MAPSAIVVSAVVYGVAKHDRDGRVTEQVKSNGTWHGADRRPSGTAADYYHLRILRAA